MTIIVSVDGKPRTYRDTKAMAEQAANREVDSASDQICGSISVDHNRDFPIGYDQSRRDVSPSRRLAPYRQVDWGCGG
jgi:hypothetical protein